MLIYAFGSSETDRQTSEKLSAIHNGAALEEDYKQNHLNVIVICRIDVILIHINVFRRRHKCRQVEY